MIRARFGEESKQEPSRLRLAVFGPKLSACAAREREKERPKKKKKFFYLEISKRIEIFFGMMMMITMLLFVFFQMGVFFFGAMLSSLYDFLSGRRGERREREG